MKTLSTVDKTQFKNKWSWIIIISMLVAMTVVFLAFGEINLSHFNWLVATNGKWWGTATDSQGVESTGFWTYNQAPLIGWPIFVIMVGILLCGCLAMVVCMLTHRLHFSSFAFIIASWAVFFTIITSGLLYPQPQATFKWQILVRVILVFVAYPVIFFPCNWIFKKCFINTKYGEAYIENLLASEQANAKAMADIQEQQKRHPTTTLESVEIDSQDL